MTELADLDQNLKELGGAIDRLVAERNALREQNAALREALRPLVESYLLSTDAAGGALSYHSEISVAPVTKARAALAEEAPLQQGTEGCAHCDGSGRVMVLRAVYEDIDGGEREHTYAAYRRPEIACPNCTEPLERERDSPV